MYIEIPMHTWHSGSVFSVAMHCTTAAAHGVMRMLIRLKVLHFPSHAFVAHDTHTRTAGYGEVLQMGLGTVLNT